MLCEYALSKWNIFVQTKETINYIDSVVGIRHEVDRRLPNDALESAKSQKDLAGVEERYREPIVALQDDDFELPDNIEFAYYAIYNVFRKYVLNQEIDNGLIINQALASEEDISKRDEILSEVVQQVI